MITFQNFRYFSRLNAPLAIVLFLTLSCGLSENSLHVMAASSLTEAFEEITEEFEKETQFEISLTIAGSASLASQIEDGAKVDVVALADEETMARLADTRRIEKENLEIFATNYLVLATPLENPGSIENIRDLKGSVSAICAPQVPCGKLSFQLAAQENVDLNPSSFEPSVRSVRTKIELGEVDAGLIYITDVNSRINFIPIEQSEQLKTNYPIASIQDGKIGSTDFIEFVLSPVGQKILKKYGFGVPS